MSRRGKVKWFRQLQTCCSKGYAAGLAGAQPDDCPYKASEYLAYIMSIGTHLEGHAVANLRGVTAQRRQAWERGRDRAARGLPECDLNG